MHVLVNEKYATDINRMMKVKAEKHLKRMIFIKYFYFFTALGRYRCWRTISLRVYHQFDLVIRYLHYLKQIFLNFSVY